MIIAIKLQYSFRPAPVLLAMYFLMFAEPFFFASTIRYFPRVFAFKLGLYQKKKRKEPVGQIEKVIDRPTQAPLCGLSVAAYKPITKVLL